MENILEIMVPVIVAIITGVLGPLVLFWIKAKKDRAKEAEEEAAKKDEVVQPVGPPIHTRDEVFNKKVELQLTEIRKRLNADRVWIMEFHNGGRLFSTSTSLQKLSILYESVAPGVSVEKSNFKSLLVSFFGQTIDKLIEEKQLIYTNLNEAENYEVVRIMEQKGNNSMYMFAMETLEDFLVGILGVDYVRSERTLTPEEIQFLNNQSNLLAGYIESKAQSVQ